MVADMTGYTVMVTGATSGLGEVTARELANMNAHVIAVGRNEAKARETVQNIKQQNADANIEYMIADLAVMQGVRDLAQAFKAKYDRLHVLVNNAGMIFTSRNLTADGYEQTFALNHLNYFLLTNLLMDELKTAGTPEHKARVVNVSSSAHQWGNLDFTNLNGEKSYSPMAAYGVSKFCNVLFTYELAHRLEEESANVTANCLHPGVVRTGFGKNNEGFIGQMTRLGTSVLQLFGLSPEKGAETQVFLASSPQVEGVSGQYFEKKQPKESRRESYNRDIQRRLWEISEEMTGISTTESTTA